MKIASPYHVPLVITMSITSKCVLKIIFEKDLLTQYWP